MQVTVTVTYSVVKSNDPYENYSSMFDCKPFYVFQDGLMAFINDSHS